MNPFDIPPPGQGSLAVTIVHGQTRPTGVRGQHVRPRIGIVAVDLPNQFGIGEAEFLEAAIGEDVMAVELGAHSPVKNHHSVAESFGNHAVWTPDLFRIPALSDARRALATLDSEPVTVVDLDDARTLLQRNLRPSDVVTRDRARTQAWSLAVFEENKWDGIRWWSRHDPDRGSYGLWNLANLSVLEVDPLDLDHPAVIDAARALNRSIER